jgi:menaquinone-9 beta-reductase
MDQSDVLIIGGGPAGLAAAIAIRSKGMSVTVTDGLRPPIDKACGEGLMPDTLRVLERLGVTIDPEQGRAFRGIRFIHDGIKVDASFPTRDGIGVRRVVLHQLLVERAQAVGVQLLWETPVALGREPVKARWIIGADGGSSRVRRLACLDDYERESVRFGFRRHYRIAPWSTHMELHWGSGCQVYVTPVSPYDVCVALISRDPHLRLDTALARFPILRDRLAGAPVASSERGAVSASRRLSSVVRGNVALIGDASGSVDAITGEGLSLAFHQAFSLADALQRGNLALYGAEHRRLMRRPALMADALLLIDRFPALRDRALRALSIRPNLFARLLAMHVGELPAPQFAAAIVALGWSLLSL